MKEATSQYDTQTLDAATAEQEQPVPNLEEEDAEEGCHDDTEMRTDDQEESIEVTYKFHLEPLFSFGNFRIWHWYHFCPSTILAGGIFSKFYEIV